MPNESNVRQLTDHGAPIYPITDRSLVIGLQDNAFATYVMSWDGASTPVPANIPAGVVVTYNGTDYTGTLAASASTAQDLYLVASGSQPGEYDRYITTHVSSTYAWNALGSTAIVSPVIADDLVTNDSSKALSAKQGKILGDKTSELEAKVTELDGGSYSIIPFANWTDDGCISGKSESTYFGTVLSSTRFSYSDYIPVRPGDTLSYLRIISTTASEAGICFYDSAYNAIAGTYAAVGTAGYESKSVVVPNSAAFVRLTKYTDDNTYGVYSSSILVSQGKVEILETKTTSLETELETGFSEVIKNNGLNRLPVNIDGANGTLVLQRVFGLLPGRSYRIDILNPDVPVTNLPTDTSVRFGVSSIGDNVDKLVLVDCRSLSTPLADHYDIILPEDTKYVLFEVRCDAGATLKMYVEEKQVDLATSVLELSNKVAELYGGINDISTLAEWTDGGCISGKENSEYFGTVLSSSRFSYTDFIPVNSGDTIDLLRIVSSTLTEAGVCFYDSEKQPIAGFYATEGNPSGYVDYSTVIPSGAAYIRMTKYTDEYTYGPYSAKITIDKGEVEKVKEIAEGDVSVESVKVEKTDVVFTARNYIVKEVEISGTMYLKITDNLGVTWHTTENIIGDIMLVHFFRDGSLLICSPTKAYYSNDYENFTESTVFDYDGSAFVGNSRNFYRLFADNSENNTIDGKEAFVWSDYGPAEIGYVSRIWYTDDKGHTLRCILKDGSVISGNDTLSIRHFHDCRWDKWAKCLWISTGDTGAQCNLIRGVVQNGQWTFTRIASGDSWKLGQIIVQEDYLYLVTDFTDGETPTGIVVVDKSNPTSYKYIYRHSDTSPFTGYFQDDFGWRVLFFDGSIYNKILVARGDMDFKEIQVVPTHGGVAQNYAITHPIGPNYNGELLVTGGSYNISQSKLNRESRYIISTVLRDAGLADFGKIYPFRMEDK